MAPRTAPRSSGCVRRSRSIACLAALLLTGSAVLAEAPGGAAASRVAPGGAQKVISINLCTDQLALMLAAPGQLLSVSRLAHDPGSSVMWQAAAALPANPATAEHVYLRAPDLVLAGTFTAPATIAMLERLGIAVEIFAPAGTLADIPAQLRRMGTLLGREAEAEAQVRAFEDGLAALRETDARRPRAALTYVNNFTSGDRTLAGAILAAAGLGNVAAEAGVRSSGVLSLEQLVLSAPDIIIAGQDYGGTARASDNLSHPALKTLAGSYHAGALTGRDWICGTPHVLGAVRDMADLRRRVLDE